MSLYYRYPYRDQGNYVANITMWEPADLSPRELHRELFDRHSRLLDSRSAGHQCPDSSMDRLVHILHDVPDEVLADSAGWSERAPILRDAEGAIRLTCEGNAPDRGTAESARPCPLTPS